MKQTVSQSRRPQTHEALKSPSALLMAMESRAMFEWASYALTWPLLKRAPRGDSHPVLVLPGLLAGDNSTIPCAVSSAI
jgi:hypothetical protein